MSREAAELARGAARQVESRGLNKGYFSGADGSVCLWGAVACEQRDQGVYWRNWDFINPFTTDPRLNDLRRALRAVLDDPARRWPGAAFNDAPGTTALDVVNVLLKVADELEVSS